MDDARYRQPPDCTACQLFVGDPDELEQAFPDLTILSSARGSTRGRAGICLARNTFQDPEPACPEFHPHRP